MRDGRSGMGLDDLFDGQGEQPALVAAGTEESRTGKRPLALAASAVGLVSALLGTGFVQVLILVGALMALALSGLRYGWLQEVELRTIGLLMVALGGLAAWAVGSDTGSRVVDTLPQGGTRFSSNSLSAGSHRKSVSPPPEPERTKRPAVEFGDPVSIGVRPGPMTTATNGLGAVTDSGLTQVDPRESPPDVDTVPIEGTIHDIAGEGGVIAVVMGVRLLFYDALTRKRIGRWYKFGDKPGQVAMKGGAAFVCNETFSKVNRVDARTKDAKRISVPGVPTHIVATADELYVSIESGVIVRIDPRYGEVTKTINLKRKRPGPLAVDDELIWVSYPADRLVVRIDRASGKQVGPPIKVAADIVELVLRDTDVWGVSRSTDDVVRIDRSTGKAITAKVPAASPSGLAVLDDTLYYASYNTGDIVPIN